MISLVENTGAVELPLIIGEYPMIPFDLNSLVGLPLEFTNVAKQMLKGVIHRGGTAYLTMHGKVLKPSQTLRRGAPHTDGNYEPVNMDFGGGGWKVGENGPPIDSETHHRQYNSEGGGLILASNHPSCLGWEGTFEGLPSVGGDCRHIKLGKPFKLQANKVYHGSNHFIHESLPVDVHVHRVFARITMPENHAFIRG